MMSEYSERQEDAGDRVSPSHVPSWRARGRQAQGPLEDIKQIAIFIQNDSMRLDAYVHVDIVLAS